MKKNAKSKPEVLDVKSLRVGDIVHPKAPPRFKIVAFADQQVQIRPATGLGLEWVLYSDLRDNYLIAKPIGVVRER